MLDKVQVTPVSTTNEVRTSPSCNAPKPMRERRAFGYSPKPLLPRTLKEAHQLADIIHRSKLAPRGFETPESCLVGILYGMEVGLSPIAALQRMAIIDGRPTIWGDAALALVQASGLLVSFREELVDMGTNIGFVATCTVTRHGRNEPVTRTFSVDDAKRAGLWQKTGPWSQYPKRMLAMRARAFALRDAFPDVLAGLYLREEIEPSEQIVPSQQITSEYPVGKTKPENATPPVQPKSKKPNDPEPVQSDGSPRRAPPPPVIEQVAVDPRDHIEKDANALITLFDDALCCAFDPETLEEIREEFQPKIDRLAKTHIEQAGRVFLKHEGRVAGINISPSGQPQTVNQLMETKNYPDGNNTPPNHPSQDSLQVKLPSVSRRRPTKGFVSSRIRPIGLLALNARQRLFALQDDSNPQDGTDDHTKTHPLADVNNLISPNTSMFALQHARTQPEPSVLLTSQHPDALSPQHQTVGQSEPALTASKVSDPVHTADQ